MKTNQNWLCGGNPKQIDFYRYARAKAGIGGFRNAEGKVSTDLLIDHLMRRIEDLEACSDFVRCSACGVAVLKEAEVRFNNNQHYCPDCCLGLVREYAEYEGLPEAMIAELAQLPFHPHGFFSGHAPTQPAWPASKYWVELVAECPEIGLRYMQARARRS